jgi:hypothetical protein
LHAYRTRAMAAVIFLPHIFLPLMTARSARGNVRHLGRVAASVANLGLKLFTAQP